MTDKIKQEIWDTIQGAFVVACIVAGILTMIFGVSRIYHSPYFCSENARQLYDHNVSQAQSFDCQSRNGKFSFEERGDILWGVCKCP